MSRPCVRCDKGVGIFVCSGCQHSFCRKHSEDHRQELFVQIDELSQDFNIFHHELAENSSIKQIDRWENDSIERIRQTASKAREILRNSMKNFEEKLDPIKMEIRQMRQDENFTEKDLKRWFEQLKIHREDLQKLVDHSIVISDEKFGEKDEFVRLFDDQRVAETISDDQKAVLPVFGTLEYSTGVHYRRIRIEKVFGQAILIGVTSSKKQNNVALKTSGGLHGLFSGTVHFKDPLIQQRFIRTLINDDDEIDFHLNCDENSIEFQNVKTKEKFVLLVDLNTCPLPWKIVVGLYAGKSRVRIVR